jgi:hypothetical protein
MIKNVYWTLYEVPITLVQFYWNLNFLGIFSENTQILNFMKIRRVGAALFHADGLTDGRTWWTLTVDFRNCVNASEKNVNINSSFVCKSFFVLNLALRRTHLNAQ